MADVFEDGEEVGHGFGAKHGDAGLTEIGDALEDRGGSEVSSGVEDASLLIDTFHIDTQEFFEDVEFLVECQLLTTEDPRAAEGGASDHHGIHAVCVESLIGLIERMDVTITYNRNMYARVALHLTNQGPVGIACVHL